MTEKYHPFCFARIVYCRSTNASLFGLEPTGWTLASNGYKPDYHCQRVDNDGAASYFLVPAHTNECFEGCLVVKLSPEIANISSRGNSFRKRICPHVQDHHHSKITVRSTVSTSRTHIVLIHLTQIGNRFYVSSSISQAAINHDIIENRC
jgi:hypothetical protein